jgi:cobaltochelatase CobS
MPARKGMTVLSVNRINETADVRTADGRVLTGLSFGQMDKNTLIKVGTALGVRWGGTPMHKSVAEIRAILAPSQSSSVRPSVPMSPTPTVSAAVNVGPSLPAAPTVPTGSSLDAVIADMVRRIMESMPLPTATVDMSAVRELLVPIGTAVATVNERVGNLHKRQDNMHADMAALSDKVDRMVPKVTQIVIKDRPAVTLKGVQHEAFPDVMTAIAARENTFLVGPAGTGKTTIVEQAAEALGLPFHAENLTAATTEYVLKGYRDGSSNYTATPLRTMFQHGGVYLLDEIDNANPNVLGVLNSALSNGFMAFPDGLVRKHDDFIAVAAGNTYGNGADAQYVGRNPIDAATLDRFAFFTVGIDESVEAAMLGAYPLDADTASTWLKAVRTARANVERYGLRLIVSPRATKGGAALLAQGMDMSKVFAAKVLKGATKDQATKVLEGVVLA